MAQIQPLAEPAELDGLPGGPWTDAQILAASQAVRSAARWHIAPRITQTVVLDHDGASRVILPSAHVVAVTSVRSLASDSPVDLTGYRFSHNGVLAGRFPSGIAVLEVTMDHGYDMCPPDLLPVIAQGATQAKLKSRGAGPFSESYELVSADDILSATAIIRRYRLLDRP